MPHAACQKAPSAKRCIKTWGDRDGQAWAGARQKAPSAKRCIKTAEGQLVQVDPVELSESTERQKVH